MHPNTRAFLAEIKLWESVGALSWPTKDFLAVFSRASVLDQFKTIQRRKGA